jgi:competence ComEA-like helix-hairpin-helix protein
MAATEKLIERLGGGGTVGWAVAAVALAPTVIPPLRRGLRGLAKAVIVQYLHVVEIRKQGLAPDNGAATAAAPPARAGRRGRPPANGSAAAGPSPAAEAARPRARRGRAATTEAGTPAPAAAAPPPGVAPLLSPRQPRAQAQAPAAETPARATRLPRGQGQAPSVEAQPVAAPARAPRQRRAQETEAPAAEATPAAPRRGRATGEGGDQRVNLNTATRAELSRLPRVGVQTADRIIEYRTQNGPIRNVRQLRQADIIPVSAAKGMRDRVRF